MGADSIYQRGGPTMDNTNRFFRLPFNREHRGLTLPIRIISIGLLNLLPILKTLDKQYIKEEQDSEMAKAEDISFDDLTEADLNL